MSKFSTPFLNKSPLKGAYTSGEGGMVYVSNREDFQNLQDRIAGAAISAIEGENDPQTQLERAQKRKAKTDAKVKKASMESSGRDDAPDYDNPEVIKLLEKSKKLQGKADAAQDLIDQRLKNKSKTFGFDDLTDDEAAIIKAMRLKK